MGRSPGYGRRLTSRGRGFESRYWILDGHFLTFFVVKLQWCLFEKTENKLRAHTKRLIADSIRRRRAIENKQTTTDKEELLTFFHLTSLPRYSVTRWLLWFSLFVHLQPWKIAQSYIKFAKVDNFFAKYEINPPKIAKDSLVFAIAAKFRKIWSHCLGTHRLERRIFIISKYEDDDGDDDGRAGAYSLTLIAHLWLDDDDLVRKDSWGLKMVDFNVGNLLKLPQLLKIPEFVRSFRLAFASVLFATFETIVKLTPCKFSLVPVKNGKVRLLKSC